MTVTAPHALCDTASGIAYRVADLLRSPEQVKPAPPATPSPRCRPDSRCPAGSPRPC